MTTLTDRYVWAVTRHLPEAQRGDIAEELRTTVADMVEGADDPSEVAERAALAELGDPRRLAARYREGRRHLIGPAVYDEYVSVLRTALGWVVPIIALLSGAGALIDDQSVGSALGAAIGGAINVAVWVAAGVTITFAVIERVHPESIAEARGEWSPNDLPDVPDPTAKGFSTGEAVLSIAVSILTIGALFWQRTRFPLTDDAGESIPLLHPDLWDGAIWVLIATLVASALVVVAAWSAGRWTWPLARLNAAVNAVALGVVAWLALDDRLLNPTALTQIADRAEWDALTIDPWVIISVVAVVEIWDAVEVFVSAWRSDRRREATGLGVR